MVAHIDPIFKVATPCSSFSRTGSDNRIILEKQPNYDVFGRQKKKKVLFRGLVPTSHIGGRMMKFKSHFDKNKMPTGRLQGQSRRRHSTTASQNAVFLVKRKLP